MPIVYLIFLWSKPYVNQLNLILATSFLRFERFCSATPFRFFLYSFFRFLYDMVSGSWFFRLNWFFRFGLSMTWPQVPGSVRILPGRKRSTPFWMSSVTRLTGLSYHWRNCMLPACSIQMMSPCAGSSILVASNAHLPSPVLVRCRAVLALASRASPCGAAGPASIICARRNHRCLPWL